MFRLDPAGPHQAYQTFRVSAPLATHHRRATCAEVACEKLERGFKIITDPTTDKGRRQAYLITHVYRRPHTVIRRPDGLVDYVFAPGVPCFANHHRPLFREPLTVIRFGDHRTPRRAREPRSVGVSEWTGRLGESVTDLAGRVARG